MEKNQTSKELDMAFIQGKVEALNEWLKENGVALQPMLHQTPMSIRATVQLIKVPTELREAQVIKDEKDEKDSTTE